MAAKKYTVNTFLKLEYEKFLGSNISVATWYRVKIAMRINGLEINTDTLKLTAELKKLFDDSKLPLEQLLGAYLEATTLHAEKVFYGKDLFAKLKNITGYKCSDVTIIRWFRDVPRDSEGNRFSQSRKYESKEIYHIFIRAIAYRNRFYGKEKTINHLSTRGRES